MFKESEVPYAFWLDCHCGGKGIWSDCSSHEEEQLCYEVVCQECNYTEKDCDD